MEYKHFFSLWFVVFSLLFTNDQKIIFMATVHKFEELEIWQLSFIIYKKISAITEKMRQKHDYRFADQMKAAAGSVMDNIAEGFERNSRLEFLNSLSISKGECGELKSQAHRVS